MTMMQAEFTYTGRIQIIILCVCLYVSAKLYLEYAMNELANSCTDYQLENTQLLSNYIYSTTSHRILLNCLHTRDNKSRSARDLYQFLFWFTLVYARSETIKMASMASICGFWWKQNWHELENVPIKQDMSLCKVWTYMWSIIIIRCVSCNILN